MRLKGSLKAVFLFLFAAFIACPNELPKEEEVFPSSEIHVVDGDTVLIGGNLIRLLGIDAPEKRSPRFTGDQEPYAHQAKAFLEKIIQEAKEIRIVYASRKDRYGRFLAHIFAKEESLSLQLVKEGLAYETVSYYGDSGFPEIAMQIREAAMHVTPLFENPFKWRKRNRLQEGLTPSKER